MKRIIIAALSFFFLFVTAIPVISKDYNRDTQVRRDQKVRPDTPSRPDYKKHSDYQNHRGYRERPYDNRRHYEHQDYKGHRYDYHGHWKSWDQWDNYAKKHPDIYKHGTYYRETAHLMFRFCEPGTANCFFFSIGR
jgi:hypothetical protein